MPPRIRKPCKQYTLHEKHQELLTGTDNVATNITSCIPRQEHVGNNINSCILESGSVVNTAVSYMAAVLHTHTVLYQNDDQTSVQNSVQHSGQKFDHTPQLYDSAFGPNVGPIFRPSFGPNCGSNF